MRRKTTPATPVSTAVTKRGDLSDNTKTMLPDKPVIINLVFREMAERCRNNKISETSHFWVTIYDVPRYVEFLKALIKVLYF